MKGWFGGERVKKQVERQEERTYLGMQSASNDTEMADPPSPARKASWLN